MTEVCYWLALITFAIAVITAAVADTTPAYRSWQVMIPLGLFLCLLPAVLTASGINHT
jgi:hypothetical protein